MIRFVHHFNYADGLSREDGERWYLEQHVPCVRDLPGVVAYRSWPQVDVGIPYPSPGAPTPHNQFARRTDLCFADLDSALRAVMGSAQLWRPAREGEPGFREFECLFLDEQPEYDLLRDAPPQHYPYMTMPLSWPLGGPPEPDLDELIFIDCYWLRYREGVPVSKGEDWYLGHHTREGKQLPGMRHYRTWRRLPVEDSAGIGADRWYRLTELGMSPEAYKATMVRDATRIRFTPGWLDVVGVENWRNISIKLDAVEDLLA